MADMKLTEDSIQAMNECGIPEYMRGGIMRFYEHGLPPGDFLSAVINNDLKEAVGRADDTNKHLLGNYITWFYNHAHSGSWGFTGAVEKWCKSVHEEKQCA